MHYLHRLAVLYKVAVLHKEPALNKHKLYNKDSAIHWTSNTVGLGRFFPSKSESKHMAVQTKTILNFPYHRHPMYFPKFAA